MLELCGVHLSEDYGIYESVTSKYFAFSSINTLTPATNNTTTTNTGRGSFSNNNNTKNSFSLQMPLDQVDVSPVFNLPESLRETFTYGLLGCFHHPSDPACRQWQNKLFFLSEYNLSLFQAPIGDNDVIFGRKVGPGSSKFEASFPIHDLTFVELTNTTGSNNGGKGNKGGKSGVVLEKGGCSFVLSTPYDGSGEDEINSKNKGKNGHSMSLGHSRRGVEVLGGGQYLVGFLCHMSLLMQIKYSLTITDEIYHQTMAILLDATPKTVRGNLRYEDVSTGGGGFFSFLTGGSGGNGSSSKKASSGSSKKGVNITKHFILYEGELLCYNEDGTRVKEQINKVYRSSLLTNKTNKLLYCMDLKGGQIRDESIYSHELERNSLIKERYRLEISAAPPSAKDHTSLHLCWKLDFVSENEKMLWYMALREHIAFANRRRTK